LIDLSNAYKSVLQSGTLSRGSANQGGFGSPLSLCDEAFFNVNFRNVQVMACTGI